MITSISLLAVLMAAGAGGDGHGCPEVPHHDGDYCDCVREVSFYGPYAPPPPVYLRAPGVRVYGRPVSVAGPVVHIQGPPVYVDAPPIRVSPAQIYLQRPDVRVRPSTIIVEPPQVHFADCEDGASCPAPGGY